MSDERNIKVEGGPTLFDGLTPQEQGDAGDPWAEILDLIDEIKQDADRAGIYVLVPTEALARRAEIYYKQNAEIIKKTLADGGATPGVIGVVCRDYINVLTGQFKFKATPEQMQSALMAITPADAFAIDRYGFYFALLTNYSRYLLRYRDYFDAVKGKAATDETKRAYLAKHFSAMDARAVRWLLNIGELEPSDFAGFEPSVMSEFFARIGSWAALGEYVVYYFVAKTALLATPQELDEIEAPPIPSQTPVQQFAATVCSETVEALNGAAEKFAEAKRSEPSPQQAQAKRAAREWNNETNTESLIKIHQNYGIVLSRPVNISPNGEQVTQTFPVRRYIDDFTARNPVYNGLITEATVQKVVEGVNLLPQYFGNRMTVGEGGRFSFDTNISEFAEICGYVDANQQQKLGLLGALQMLDNLFFVVDKPKRFEERTTNRGRKKIVQVGGLVAMRFLVIRRVGLELGELFIEVYPESLKGRPTFMTEQRYKALRAKAKGLTQSRFNAQISSKSHKSERDLIDEVFGLADMKQHAKPDDLPNVTRYIQNHRSDFRKKVLGWFQDYVDAGILTTFSREPSKTDKRDFVLSWTCPDASKLDPPPYDPNGDYFDDTDLAASD